MKIISIKESRQRATTPTNKQAEFLIVQQLGEMIGRVQKRFAIPLFWSQIRRGLLDNLCPLTSTLRA